MERSNVTRYDSILIDILGPTRRQIRLRSKKKSRASANDEDSGGEDGHSNDGDIVSTGSEAAEARTVAAFIDEGIEIEHMQLVPSHSRLTLADSV